MRILFISMTPFAYNTSATIQNKGIVRGLVGLGYDVDTLTLQPLKTNFSYDVSMNDIAELIGVAFYIEPDEKYKLLMSKKRTASAKTVNKGPDIVKVILQTGRSLVKRMYESFSVFDAQITNIRNVFSVKIDYSEYDVIISASDPKSSHLIADRIFRKIPGLNSTWIQYWGDPMFHDITRKRDWRDGIVKYHERRLISKADRVIYASPLTLQKQRDTFPEFSHKMDYASQVYAGELGSLPSSSNEQIKPISVGYFGAYRSTVRNIIPLYRVAQGATFMLTICGATDLSLPSTDNVRIMNFVSYDESVRLEQDSDILVCICNLRGTQIPGKIYYYTAYQKPIIVVLDGEYKDELRTYLASFERFILCDNNENSIRAAIAEAKTQVGRSHYELADQLKPEYMAKKILGQTILRTYEETRLAVNGFNKNYEYFWNKTRSYKNGPSSESFGEERTD